MIKTNGVTANGQDSVDPFTSTLDEWWAARGFRCVPTLVGFVNGT